MNNEQHLKIKKTLKVAGVIVLAAGLVLTLTGFVNFFSSASSGEMPTLFWCSFLGLPMLAAGLTMLLWGFRRELVQYTKNEVTPVAGEALADLTPAVADMARAARADTVACPGCGTKNDADAKFCSECGAPLAAVCKACGATNDTGAKFCSNCGKPL